MKMVKKRKKEIKKKEKETWTCQLCGEENDPDTCICVTCGSIHIEGEFVADDAEY